MWLESWAVPVLVYRCIDPQGRVSLQDRPCARDETQQRRQLRRPPSAPPPDAIAIPLPPEPPSEPPARESAEPPQRTPQPLYECQRFDGSSYESDTGLGQRRWVPLWVLGLDPRAPAQTFGPVGRPPPRPPLERPGSGEAGADPRLAPALGAWVEDRCYRLPAAQACERRRARLSELGRRIFNALQSERDRLRPEEDRLRAQLRAECGFG
jgi:hypothetical protein